MKQKSWAAAGAGLLLLAAFIWFFANYALVNGALYSRNMTTLDLSGTTLENPAELSKMTHLELADLRNTGLTPEDYDMLREALPGCEILWLVPFQGEYLDPDTTRLTLTSITEEEMDLLRYFPSLEAIDMTGCTDVDAILKLRERYPQCEIPWLVPFRDGSIPYDAEHVTLPALSVEDLDAFAHLSYLKTVDARECADLEAVAELVRQYPHLTVTWQVPIQDKAYGHDTDALDLADADAEELMDQLQYLPQLKSVALTGTAPNNEAMYALKQTYPHVEFIWDFTLCGVTVSSNATEIDLSNIKMESVEEVENSLKYFHSLQKVIMCKCGIPSEEMDALWKRHPEIRFVWSAYFAGQYVRTDATTFMPWKLGYTKNGVPGMSNKAAAELKYLVDLVAIDIGHNNINDLSFLYYMPNVEYLMMCCSGVSDLTPVGSLKKLKYLEIWENNITDLSPLAGCTALEDINFTYTAAEDLSPLFGLNLKNIWFSGKLYSDEQVQALLDHFPGSTVKYKGEWPTSLGWRDIPNYFKQRDLLGMFYMESAED